MSSFIRSLLLDLDPYAGNDPDGMFSLFYKTVARNLAPKLTVILDTWLRGQFTARLEVTWGCPCVKGIAFSECWRL